MGASAKIVYTITSVQYAAYRRAAASRGSLWDISQFRYSLGDGASNVSFFGKFRYFLSHGARILLTNVVS